MQCLRMGGGFGGKEMQPHGFAAVAALGARLTGRPVRLRLTRAQDMTMTGKRHGFHAQWRVAFDEDGLLQALDATLTSDGGWSLDLSEPVLARALCHVDNAYWIPAVRVNGRIARTNKTSQTAFRGLRRPAGDARHRGRPRAVRAAARASTPPTCAAATSTPTGQSTPYGQPVRHPDRMVTCWEQVLASGDVAARQAADRRLERPRTSTPSGPWRVTPVKFGISFNFTAFNQAGALVHVYKDGSVLVTHGGTEMGQGLHTKMLQVAATALGVPLSTVRLAPTRTDKVPNTSATAASSGADLNGAAVKDACEQVLDRLRPVAAEHLGVAPDAVRFGDGVVTAPGTEESIGWADLVNAAYFQRVQLWAAGFYRTEGLHWDSATMQGAPFKYFSYGAAASEVEVDGFTGEYRLRRVDIVHDVGDSLSPARRPRPGRGGVRAGRRLADPGGPAVGRGDGPTRGALATHAASTYKLPSFSEMPEDFRVALLERAHEDGAVYGSKAVGEPPLMLAFSVREALRQAAAAFGPAGTSVDLASPATPEAVWWALEAARRHPGCRSTAGGRLGAVPDQPDHDAHPLRPHSERATRPESRV